MTRSVESFQIRSMGGDIITGPIQRLDRIVDFLLTYGISEIAKISFYIVDTRVPDEFCNVILRNQEGIFVPEFCETHQDGDWQRVLQALDYRNLDDMFVKYIRYSVEAEI